MALNPYSKAYYEHLKKFGNHDDRVATARLSKAYCLIDPEAAGWIISEARARNTLLPPKAPPVKPEEQKKALSLEDELEMWSREEAETEDIPPVRPIQELDDSSLPF